MAADGPCRRPAGLDRAAPSMARGGAGRPRPSPIAGPWRGAWPRCPPATRDIWRHLLDRIPAPGRCCVRAPRAWHLRRRRDALCHLWPPQPLRRLEHRALGGPAQGQYRLRQRHLHQPQQLRHLRQHGGPGRARPAAGAVPARGQPGRSAPDRGGGGREAAGEAGAVASRSRPAGQRLAAHRLARGHGEPRRGPRGAGADRDVHDQAAFGRARSRHGTRLPYGLGAGLGYRQLDGGAASSTGRTGSGCRSTRTRST